MTIFAGKHHQFLDFMDTPAYEIHAGTMERFDCLSTMLYYRVNEIIGDRELVSIRRDYADLFDTFDNSSQELARLMFSGSKREGLDMTGSDTDFMIWSPNIYVIWDTTQSHYYNTATDTLLLAEHGLTRPGFVLLRLLHQAYTLQAQSVLLSYISLQNHIYISSSKHRQFCFDSYAASPTNWASLRLFLNVDLHGPCTSGRFDGHETDLTLCFRCLHWPPQAFSWLQRCQRLCWPRPSVLQDITLSGCHFVAIGAKQSIFENVEWRLSFSQAEQKLIYSFNHCQLLVYGLLKLFLKEVLISGIPENQKLLCSYFMKTALFWQIQGDILTRWSVDNFLLCFWNCFKLLIKWVNCQYCPNFFVPENNMFFPKITGRDQQRLLSQLLGLYNEGFVCLLRSASIQDKIISAALNPYHLIYELHSSEIKKDIALSKCGFMKFSTHHDYIKYIHFFIIKFRSSTTKTQRWTFFYSKIIQHCQMFALFQQMTHRHCRKNVEIYTLKKQSLNLLKQTSRLGSLTDVIYLAMYYYIDGRYIQALCLLQEIKCKLYKPYIIYYTVNPDIYIQTMGGKPLSTKTKEALACDILIPTFANLPELRLELRVLEQFTQLMKHFFVKPSRFDLLVSPFLLVHFLTFLCHHHLDSTQQRQQALHDLNTLVQNADTRYMIINPNKSTAWQLLGICHQINQNPQQALQCYRKSLTLVTEDVLSHALTKATHYRIKFLERQLLEQNIFEPPLD